MRLATRQCNHRSQILTTVNFLEVRQLSKGMRIAKGDIVNAVMSEGREGRNSS